MPPKLVFRDQVLLCHATPDSDEVYWLETVLPDGTVRMASLEAIEQAAAILAAAGIGDIEFEWHDFARIWQTPQAGEAFWDQQLAAPAEERAGVFQMFGVPGESAIDLASHINRTMADCILDLYRSAVDVGEQWGPDFAAIPAPGLVIIPSEEPFMRAVSSTRAAVRADAAVAGVQNSARPDARGLRHVDRSDPLRAARGDRRRRALPRQRGHAAQGRRAAGASSSRSRPSPQRHWSRTRRSSPSGGACPIPARDGGRSSRFASNRISSRTAVGA